MRDRLEKFDFDQFVLLLHASALQKLRRNIESGYVKKICNSNCLKLDLENRLSMFQLFVGASIGFFLPSFLPYVILPR